MSAAERAADAILGRFRRDDGPGLAVGALREGTILLRKGYGLADVDAGAPNGTDVPMRIASLSKQFLVFVALLLEAEGRLSTDDDVRAHLPWLPDYGARVTLMDLMSNQSGVRDFLELRLLSGGNFADPGTDEENVALAAASGELNFPPRSRFAYSNTGFTLLTKVVEAVEGEALETIFRRRIFDPLGMTKTSLCRRDKPWLDGRAVPYVETGAQRMVGRWGVPLDGAGGVVSTVDDLLLWAAHVLDDSHPHASIFRRMMEARPYANGMSSLYGLGFTVMPHRGLASFGHHGQLPGVFAEIAFFPQIAAAIVLLANTDDLNPFETGRRLADALFADDFQPLPPAERVRPGLFADLSRDLVVEIADGPEGSQTLSSVMTTATIEWHRRGRFRPLWPMLHLDLAVDGDELVGFDGPDPVRLQRLTPMQAGDGKAVRGEFVQADLRSVWTLEDDAASPVLELSGALGTARYALQPIAPDLFQARPSADPVGPYRPIVRFGKRGDTRCLVVTTDRTAHLSAPLADSSSLFQENAR